MGISPQSELGRTLRFDKGLFLVSSYLFLGPELVKHLLNLMLPVILQAVEGILGHFEETRLLDGSELV